MWRRTLRTTRRKKKRKKRGRGAFRRSPPIHHPLFVTVAVWTETTLGCVSSLCLSVLLSLLLSNLYLFIPPGAGLYSVHNTKWTLYLTTCTHISTLFFHMIFIHSWRCWSFGSTFEPFTRKPSPVPSTNKRHRTNGNQKKCSDTEHNWSPRPEQDMVSYWMWVNCETLLLSLFFHPWLCFFYV